VYSPKIDQKHIPVLYQIGKRTKRPMTQLVNEAITEYIANVSNLSTSNPKQKLN